MAKSPIPNLTRPSPEQAAVGEEQPAVWTPRKNYPHVTDSYRRYLEDEVLRDLQVSVTRVYDKKYNAAYGKEAREEGDALRWLFLC